MATAEVAPKVDVESLSDAHAASPDEEFGGLDETTEGSESGTPDKAESVDEAPTPVGDYDLDPEEKKSVVDETSSDKEATSESEDADSGFDDELVERAQDVGLEPDDFASPSALERMVRRIERTLPPEQAATISDPPTSENGEPGKFELTLSEDVDPDLAKAVKAMNEHYHTQNMAMHKRMGQLQTGADRVAGEQQVHEFDRLIAGLGDEWHDTFGKGPSRRLGTRSKAHIARKKLAEEIEYRLGRGRGSDIEDVFEHSLSTVFSKQKDSMVRKTISKKMNRRQTTAKPTQRTATASTKSPEAGAEDFVKRFAKEKGLEDELL